jgi:hypothetical protein
MAADFDGINQHVLVDDADDLSFGNALSDSPFSISVWVNMDDASGFYIVGKGSSAAREYQFYVQGTDELVFLLLDNDANNNIKVTSDGKLTSYENQWIHLVGTYTGSGANTGLSLYLNGVPFAATVGSGGSYTAMHNQAQTVTVGRLPNDVANYANGSIEDVRVYDKVLSQAEITTLAGGGDVSGAVLQVPLDGYYEDISGNGHTVTNSGTTVVAGPSQLQFSRAPYLSPEAAQAFSFDPTPYLSLSTGAVLVWAKPPDATPAEVLHALWSVGDTDGATYMYLGLVSTGKLKAVLRVGGTVQWIVETNAAVWVDNTWGRAGISHNGTTPTLTFNGTVPAQTLTTSTAPEKWWADITGLVDDGRIGCINFNSAGNTDFFRGGICEVVTLNRALDLTGDLENGLDYNGGLGIDPRDTVLKSAILGYYKMLGGDYLTDRSGNANTLIAINSAGAVENRRTGLVPNTRASGGFPGALGGRSMGRQGTRLLRRKRMIA